MYELGWNVYSIAIFIMSHFLGIAYYGYLYDQNVAFLPLLPFLLKQLLFLFYIVFYVEIPLENVIFLMSLILHIFFSKI